jgi:prepilin-type N-terminal cleavage/methylation domain-containing protein
MARTPSTTDSRGFTLIELMATVAIVGILAALAVPALMRAKMSANEVSAIGSLKAINAAQAAYASSAAGGGFATQLSVLAIACPGQSNGFLAAELAVDPSMKSGYSIVLAPATGSAAGPNDCNGTASRAGYYLTAAPASEANGRRGFATSNTAVIFFDLNGVPPTEAAMAPGGPGQVIQ